MSFHLDGVESGNEIAEECIFCLHLKVSVQSPIVNRLPDRKYASTLGDGVKFEGRKTQHVSCNYNVSVHFYGLR